jgi:hypothetical protein
MKASSKGTFFRVQSAQSGKTGKFEARSMPSGSKVISIRRDTYLSAKKAAAKAMARDKQPA